MQKECKISSDGTPEMQVSGYVTVLQLHRYTVFSTLFLAGMLFSERNRIIQRVFSCRKVYEASILIYEIMNSHFSAGFFVPSTHHHKTPWQGNSSLKFGIHSTSSFLFCSLSDYSNNKREMRRSFSLLCGSSLLGSLVLFPLVCQAAAHMKQKMYFPRSKCSVLHWQTVGFSKIT